MKRTLKALCLFLVPLNVYAKTAILCEDGIVTKRGGFDKILLHLNHRINSKEISFERLAFEDEKLIEVKDFLSSKNKTVSSPTIHERLIATDTRNITVCVTVSEAP